MKKHHLYKSYQMKIKNTENIYNDYNDIQRTI